MYTGACVNLVLLLVTYLCVNLVLLTVTYLCVNLVLLTVTYLCVNLVRVTYCYLPMCKSCITYCYLPTHARAAIFISKHVRPGCVQSALAVQQTPMGVPSRICSSAAAPGRVSELGTEAAACTNEARIGRINIGRQGAISTSPTARFETHVLQITVQSTVHR